MVLSPDDTASLRLKSRSLGDCGMYRTLVQLLVCTSDPMLGEHSLMLQLHCVPGRGSLNAPVMHFSSLANSSLLHPPSTLHNSTTLG